MARSLTVSHDEKPSTNRLLNVFLLIAAGWLAAAALGGWSSDAPAAPIESLP